MASFSRGSPIASGATEQINRCAACGLRITHMISIWIHPDFETGNEGVVQKQRLRTLIESKTQTLQESSEQAGDSITNVRCECGNRFPWKILADGDADVSELVKGLHRDIGDILGIDKFQITVGAS